MNILLTTDNNITGTEAFRTHFTGVIGEQLSRFAGRITRVEAHLTDQDGGKHSANDKRCVLEARVEGLNPVAVTNEANTPEQAIHGAIDKLKHALDHALGKRNAT